VKTAEKINQEFMTGARHWAGKGIYGNGTYASNVRGTALDYAGGRGGSIMHMGISKDAKVLSSRHFDSNRAAFNTWQSQIQDMGAKLAKPYRDAGDWQEASRIESVTEDIAEDWGAYALAHGYDAIEVSHGAEKYLVILDRSVLTISRELQTGGSRY
jgi:hypothetical protein